MLSFKFLVVHATGLLEKMKASDENGCLYVSFMEDICMVDINVDMKMVDELT